jgi:magnesium-transporting ATPase (P-type)
MVRLLDVMGGTLTLRKSECSCSSTSQVMARCSPQDKLTMVRRLKEMGEVCTLPPHTHAFFALL